jgi:hypothetical protein
MMSTPSPILLFAFRRPDTLIRTVAALQQNDLAKESELFVFSDAAKNAADRAKVGEVRKYIRTITGFKSVHIFESTENKGLGNSIIEGVTRIINEQGKVIVLEDDLVTSRNFLSFMNQGLDFYRDHPAVFSIGGYTRPVDGLNEKEVYFTKRASSWGWATWKEKWQPVDWEVKDYDRFRNDKEAKKGFNRMGSDMAGMLDKQMRGEINSWAIRWCYHQFKKDLVTVYPARSKVRNIGFAGSASHTRAARNGFGTELDETDNTGFNFPDKIELDKNIIKQFTKPYSIPERIKYKLLNALPSL